MTGGRSRTIRADHGLAMIAAAAAPVLLLSGCALLPDNVQGSFACKAPGGTCAPSAVIDDAAIQAIRDATAAAAPDDGQRRMQAAGMARSGRGGQGGLQAPRTMRIVFLPHVDRQGRLHEKAIVHVALTETSASDVQPVLADSADGVRTPGLLALAEQAPELEQPGPIAGLSPAGPETGAGRVPATAPHPSVGPSPLDAIKADVTASLERTRKAANFPAMAE
ncbi:MAG: TraV family lipoprotein [Pseudomonadota bacterium]